MANDQKSSVLVLGRDDADTKQDAQAVEPAAADQAVTETVDVTADEPVEEASKVSVQLNSDFEGGVDRAIVSVANYDDIVLEAGKAQSVPAAQAELLLSSPAVEVAE